MKLLSIFAAVALLAGCASITPQPFNGPNGGQAYHMDCSGFGRSMGACMAKAGELCPTGYTIINLPSGGSVGLVSNGVIGVAHKQSMAVECKR